MRLCKQGKKSFIVITRIKNLRYAPRLLSGGGGIIKRVSAQDYSPVSNAGVYFVH